MWGLIGIGAIVAATTLAVYLIMESKEHKPTSDNRLNLIRELGTLETEITSFIRKKTF